jgi:transposase
VIGSTRQISVWAVGVPVDMRKSFDTLHALVTSALKRDLLQGDLFLFVGKDRKRAKVLLWDGTGVCIYAKRLSKGRFTAPWAAGGPELRMTVSELTLFLEGSTLAGKVPLSPAPFTWSDTLAGKKRSTPQQ